MKIFITTSFTILLALNAFSQNYMESIASKSCDCLDEVSNESTAEQFNLELGLCMIEAARPYAAELLKDHNIDFDKIDTQGEELGRLIGMKMAAICPKKLVAVANRMSESNSDNDSDIVSVAGTVTRVKEGAFVEFSLDEGDGTFNKYSWITKVDSDINLVEEYNNLVGKRVMISFKDQEVFDGRIGEYRNFRVIVSLNLQ